jgi:curli biogenesis system outer membrane secretion channel CsgG
MRAARSVHKGGSIRVCQVALGVSILAIAATPAWTQTQQKKIVAVFDFTNAAVQGGVNSTSLQTSAADLGKGVSELLVSKLVQDGIVSVVERIAIDKILAEQNLSNSDRADPATAAKLGRLLGADGVVLGTIIRYDYNEKMKGYAGGGKGRRSAPSLPTSLPRRI